ncbi:MAG: kelch repeat-containing protein [Syntrophobacteraceae bacterium]
MRKIIVLFLFLLSPVFALAESPWKFIAPMPMGRYAHGATLGLDGKIYVMGGIAFRLTETRLMWLDEGHGIHSNLVYDPKEDSWKYLNPVPGIAAGSHFVYNQQEESWEGFEFMGQKGDLYMLKGAAPYAARGKYLEISPDKIRNTDFQRQGNGVAIVTVKDGKIWWIGGSGCEDCNGEDIVFPYDPVKDEWPKVTGEHVKSPEGGGFVLETTYHIDIARMQEKRMGHKAVVASDGKIYVLGGFQRRSKAVLNSMECYDPRTNTWEYKKPLSSVRMRFGAVIGPDDKIYVFGGTAGMANKKETPVLDTTEVYDPRTDSWSIRKPMPEPRQAHAAVLAANGKIYILGGSIGIPGIPLADVFIYDPAQDSWERGPGMNTRRGAVSAVATPEGKIYAIGGTDVGAYAQNQKLNFLRPKDDHLYTGKVQDTVEVLDITK